MAGLPSFGFLPNPAAEGEKAPDAETPFRIALLGSFGGMARDKDIRKRKPRKAASIDAVDEILSQIKPRLDLSLPDGCRVPLTIQELEDFHPDHLFERSERFEDGDQDEQTELMKAILRHPAFRELESAWRGLDWLLRHFVRSEGRIELVLYDVGRDELIDDLTAADDLSKSALYNLLIEQGMQGPKGSTWGLWIGSYVFDMTPRHLDALGRMAKLGRRASASFLASADPRLLDKDFEPDAAASAAYQALRNLPEANLVGLALPRFLLRLPYGSNTRSIDKFDFEEFTTVADRAGYLWGPSSLISAALMGMGFIKQSWAFKPGGILDLVDMPMHVYQDEEDEQQVTVTEQWLERPLAEKLGKMGIMPVLPVKGKNAVQLFKFTALATPPKGKSETDLLGKWGQKGFVQLPTSSSRPPIGVSFSYGGEAIAPPPLPSAVSGAAPEGEALPESPPPAPEAPAEEAMDPELAALMAQLDDPGAAPPAAAPAAEEAMDPELAALLAQLDQPAAGEAAAAPPAEEAMDPELAALLAQLDEPAAVATPTEAALPAEETVDPELAALLAQLDEPAADATSTEAAPPAEETVDPELAALLAQLDEPAADATPTEAAPPDKEAVAPELAALLAQQDQPAEGTPAATAAPTTEATLDPELAALLANLDQPAAEPTAEVAKSPTEETVDPELVALLGELDANTPPASIGDNLSAQIDALGGLAKLEDLGWPTFVHAFAIDRERQLRILQGGLKNKGVEKEIADLLKKTGGFAKVAAQELTPEMGLNAQLARLRELRQQRDDQALLDDPEALEMARAYRAVVKGLTPADKLTLLTQVRDYDKWAMDPRNSETASALDKKPFPEKRKAQLEQQLNALGGEAAYQQQLAGHPQDGNSDASVDAKVVLLRSLKEYDKLGGDAAFQAKAGGAAALPLPTRLLHLKAILAAQE